MTVPVQTLSIAHAAPVQLGEYAVPFRYWGDEHVRVRFRLDTDPVTWSDDLAVDVDYSLDPAGLSYAGGTLTLLAAVPADATHLDIEPDTIVAQETALPAVARHYERAIDRLAMIAQEQGVTLDGFEADVETTAQNAADAGASATAAATSEANAATSEANAATSEANAATSAGEAEAWAETPEDTEVEPGQFSALHHAAKAAGAATTAVSARIGNSQVVDARADVPGLNIAAAITGLLLAGFAVPGDGGLAYYQRAGAEPAHALKVQSGDGAWWEFVPDRATITVLHAGADPTGVNPSGQAFLDALDFATAGDNGEATYGVDVPPGNYDLGTTTLEFKKAVHLRGTGRGSVGDQPAKLMWDANVTGIVVHTDMPTNVATSARGSIIEGLRLASAGGTIAGVTDDMKGHGIWLRGNATLRDLIATDFPGHGYMIFAMSSGADDVIGNVNVWSMDTCRATRNHLSGLFVDGNNVNAGSARGVDCSSNGRWGIWDSSLLGNTYVGCHTQSNGFADDGENGGTKSSVVHFGGNRYCAAVAATEADLVATQPGTDPDVWIDMGAGGENAGVVPTWQAGQPEGTYFHGGSYRTDNANAENLLLGCYVEPGQGFPQYVFPTILVGGVEQHTAKGGYVQILASSTEGRFKVAGPMVLDGKAGQSIVFRKDGVNVWAFDSNNHLRPTVDAVSDLGSASMRVRDGYLSRNLRVQGRVREPFVPVPQITGNVTALDPGTGAVFKLSSDGAYQIEGVVAGADGDKINLFQTVGFTLTFVHASGVCAATERIFFTDTVNNAIGQHGAIALRYDGDALVWRGWML